MNIKQDLIPKSNRNRPGTKINPTYITVHETANTSTGADAESHARYVKGQAAIDRSVSWHYTADDSVIIQHLPDNERGWHAGNGNGSSIGIELCVNSDGDFQQTKRNAAALIQRLMKKHNIPLARVVTHKHWTGKNCPARLLNEWNAFKQLIAGSTSASQTGGTQVTAPSKPAPAKPSTSGLLQRGSKGKDVKALQDQLLSLGYKLPRFGADSDFGKETEDAVKAFQEDQGIGVDGIAGPDTFSKLAAAVKSKSQTQKEYVSLPASAATWRTYKTNVQPVKDNSDWSLTPKTFGGLEYEIIGKPQKDVVTINTSRGKRNIYVASSTGAKIYIK